MKRRTLLQGMAALSVSPLLSCSRGTPESTAGNRLERIGIQLYTVRERMAADVPGTLQALAEVGYDEVEFAGYFDHPPTEVRAFLDANVATIVVERAALFGGQPTQRDVLVTERLRGLHELLRRIGNSIHRNVS